MLRTMRLLRLHRLMDTADDGDVGGAAGIDTDGFDMNGALDTLSSDLFPSSDNDTPPTDDGDDEPPLDAATPKTPATPEESATPITRQAPQSWKKEMHTAYSTLPPDVQEYIEQREQQMRDGLEKDRGDANLGRTMRDVMTPFRDMLQSQGVDEPNAVKFLLNAHYKLSNGPAEARAQYFAGLAQQYGIDIAGLPAQPAAVDPAIKALQDELNGIKSHLTASQQQALNQTKQRVASEVDAFAAQPEHQYFDEVAEEVVAFLSQGHELKAAYEKAVWANPVTRQKEIARIQTENEQTSREKAKQEVDKAKKAASHTVRNRDTRKTPTESKGSMNDLEGSLNDTLREIRSRTH